MAINVAATYRRVRNGKSLQRDRQHDEILRHLRDLLEAQSVTMRAVHDHLMATRINPLAHAGVASGIVAEGKENV